MDHSYSRHFLSWRPGIDCQDPREGIGNGPHHGDLVGDAFAEVETGVDDRLGGHRPTRHYLQATICTGRNGKEITQTTERKTCQDELVVDIDVDWPSIRRCLQEDHAGVAGGNPKEICTWHTTGNRGRKRRSRNRKRRSRNRCRILRCHSRSSDETDDQADRHNQEFHHACLPH
jgi:hypothetical protein